MQYVFDILIVYTMKVVNNTFYVRLHNTVSLTIFWLIMQPCFHEDFTDLHKILHLNVKIARLILAFRPLITIFKMFLIHQSQQITIENSTAPHPVTASSGGEKTDGVRILSKMFNIIGM